MVDAGTPVTQAQPSLAAESELVLSCYGLRKIFTQAGNEVPVLLDVNLEVRKGESVAIVGASGSGKSTLLHLLGGLDDSSGGRVTLLGHEIGSLSESERGRMRNRGLGDIVHIKPQLVKAGSHGLK